jgi:hypothetical protein
MDADRRSIAEAVALDLLARDGIGAIWQLNIVAADAHRSGHRRAAQSVLEIAEAAEEAWMRAEGTRSYIGGNAASEPTAF